MHEDISNELIYNNSDNCVMIDRSKYCFKIDSFIDFEKDVCIDKRNNVLTRIDDDNNNKSIDIDNHYTKDIIAEKEESSENVTSFNESFENEDNDILLKQKYDEIKSKDLGIKFELPFINLNKNELINENTVNPGVFDEKIKDISAHETNILPEEEQQKVQENVSQDLQTDKKVMINDVSSNVNDEKNNSIIQGDLSINQINESLPTNSPSEISYLEDNKIIEDNNNQLEILNTSNMNDKSSAQEELLVQPEVAEAPSVSENNTELIQPIVQENISEVSVSPELTPVNAYDNPNQVVEQPIIQENVFQGGGGTNESLNVSEHNTELIQPTVQENMSEVSVSPELTPVNAYDNPNQVVEQPIIQEEQIFTPITNVQSIVYPDFSKNDVQTENNDSSMEETIILPPISNESIINDNENIEVFNINE